MKACNIVFTDQVEFICTYISGEIHHFREGCVTWRLLQDHRMHTTHSYVETIESLFIIINHTRHHLLIQSWLWDDILPSRVYCLANNNSRIHQPAQQKTFPREPVPCIMPLPIIRNCNKLALFPYSTLLERTAIRTHMPTIPRRNPAGPSVVFKLTASGSVVMGTCGSGRSLTIQPLSISLFAMISIIIYCRLPFSNWGTYMSLEIRNDCEIFSSSASRPSACLISVSYHS